MQTTSTAFVLRMAALLATLFLAWQTSAFAILQNGLLESPRASLDQYMDGTADKPFAYRMLVPAVLRGIDAVTPPAVDASLDEFAASVMTRPGDLAPVLSGPEDKNHRAILWLAILDTACLFGYALFGASLFARFFPDTRIGLLAPVLLVALVRVIVNQHFHHLYDFVTLLMMASLLWAMVRERHLLFLGLFAVACLNKETAILATLGYAAIFFGRMPWRRYAAMLGAQAAIFLAVYLTALALYASNGGASLEVWIPEQVAYLQRQGVDFYVVAAMNVFLLAYCWKEKPDILKRAAIMVIPNAALFVAGGYPGEYRAFFETYLVLCLLSLRNAELVVRNISGALNRPAAPAN